MKHQNKHDRMNVPRFGADCYTPFDQTAREQSPLLLSAFSIQGSESLESTDNTRYRPPQSQGVATNETVEMLAISILPGQHEAWLIDGVIECTRRIMRRMWWNHQYHHTYHATSANDLGVNRSIGQCVTPLPIWNIPNMDVTGWYRSMIVVAMESRELTSVSRLK